MCFTAGMLIETAEGPVAVEDLRPGQRVRTQFNGAQAITGIAHVNLSGRQLLDAPHFRPVHVAANAFGADSPNDEGLVSPNQRFLVSKERTSLLFKEKEALVAAKHLIDHDFIQPIDVVGVDFFHLQFSQHEIVRVNGVWSECFQPHDYSLGAIGNAQRNEVLELFPALRGAGPAIAAQSAQRTGRRKMRFAFR